MEATETMDPLASQFDIAVDVSTLPSTDTRATTRGQPAVATVEPGAQPRQPSVRKRPSVDRVTAPTQSWFAGEYSVQGRFARIGATGREKDCVNSPAMLYSRSVTPREEDSGKAPSPKRE